jgi:hypothetical protein
VDESRVSGYGFAYRQHTYCRMQLRIEASSAIAVIANLSRDRDLHMSACEKSSNADRNDFAQRFRGGKPSIRLHACCIQ